MSVHLSLYWCSQTFPLPWQTSCSRLQLQDTLQMSTCLRTEKHKIYSSNSAGRSVSFLISVSEIIPFRFEDPSTATDVAIFTVYPDYLIAQAPPHSGAGGRTSSSSKIRRRGKVGLRSIFSALSSGTPGPACFMILAPTHLKIGRASCRERV